jgi:hypothetical protein
MWMRLVWIAVMIIPMVGMSAVSVSMRLSLSRRHGRVNMIAALCKGQLLAPFTVEGSCNRNVERNLVRNLLNSSTRTWASRNCG